MLREEDGFSLRINVPALPGLLWYAFQLTWAGETCWYGPRPGRQGGEGQIWLEEPPSYQVTLYRPWTLPTWYTQGVVYQVYVDRFCRSADWLSHYPQAEAGEYPLLHLQWEDKPFYDRAKDGTIRRWDFFGGSLQGLESKLLELHDLGVTVLYLNPIFLAVSNHKYDTCDYHQIDPGYGTEEDFRHLLETAAKLGMYVLLDGVFSHTGADSKYFDIRGRFGNGACQGPASPYYAWYRFQDFPTTYACWWGVKDLPNVEENEPTYQDFIYGSDHSVLAHWLKEGIMGFRLDVADELPESFIRDLRQSLKTRQPQGVLVGEVWEDASHKETYGQVRNYFQGDALDGVMNYPWRLAWLRYLLLIQSSEETAEALLALYENYPPPAYLGSWNLLGSHDRIRILTLLGGGMQEGEEGESQDLTPSQRVLGLRRLKLLVLIQMCSPGLPMLYYGDEVGLEGGSDPDNRRPYPWGNEEESLKAWVKKCISLRRQYPQLVQGDFHLTPWQTGLKLERHLGDKLARLWLNPGEETLTLPTGEEIPPCSGTLYLEENGIGGYWI